MMTAPRQSFQQKSLTPIFALRPDTEEGYRYPGLLLTEYPTLSYGKSKQKPQLIFHNRLNGRYHEWP